MPLPEIDNWTAIFAVSIIVHHSLKGQCVGIVYNRSHAVMHDFIACEIINVM